MIQSKKRGWLRVMCLAVFLSGNVKSFSQQTTSLWLFDETTGLYPSSVLENSSANDYPLALGLGGKIVPGKYGNALEISGLLKLDLPKGEADFGLADPPGVAPSDKVLTWKNSNFAALMMSGKTHLRNQVGFANASDTRLNLGAFDWTVECWMQLLPGATGNRVVFELGNGPVLGEGKTTCLYIDQSNGSLVLKNDGSVYRMPSKSLVSASKWQHFALVYDHAAQLLVYYLDGKEAGRVKGIEIKSLASNSESFFTIGRDGNWNHPLQGRIDELKISEGKVYTKNFPLPLSNSQVYRPGYRTHDLQKGMPLLFENPSANKTIELSSRKHLFIDSAFVQSMKGLSFVVNPPLKMERVMDNIKGQFRKHLTVVEDEKGVIRIYNGGVDDYLNVFTSTDGVHFEAPDLGKGSFKGSKNIAIAEPTGGTGNPFIDPNGPAEERWKYIGDYHRRGVYLFTSPDGYNWTRKKTALLPFRSGTQSCTFYDDQRQRYISFHRSDIGALPNDQNVRSSALTEFVDLDKQLAYKPYSQQDYLKAAETIALRNPLPWFLDNGPLTPGGFGLEFPRHFNPIPEDPTETDIYVTKAQKYEWAPDTYVAFPIVYFHYEGAQQETRRMLEDKKYQRGSGPLETQLAVSRDGINWKRFGRPVYVGIGQHAGRDIKTAYIAHGMVRRGNEIWQYYFGETQYHSALKKDDAGRGVYRLVQRLDGFVSLDSPYDTESELVTKPFTFTGNTLQLNIDTDATGYAQVGFVDANGQPIEGLSVDKCVYINGDFIETPVEWVTTGTDVSRLQGKTVRLKIKMRGSKLYSLQFVNNPNSSNNK